MENNGICARVCEYGKYITGALNQGLAKGGEGIAAIYAMVIAWLSGLVISEATLVKTFLVSVGIVIGATFSDFIKKHRRFFVLIAIAALAAFLYKVFTELEDDEEF